MRYRKFYVLMSRVQQLMEHLQLILRTLPQTPDVINVAQPLLHFFLKRIILKDKFLLMAQYEEIDDIW